MQVIQICRNHINLNDIFEKGTFVIKQQLETCIDACKKYRQSYNQVFMEFCILLYCRAEKELSQLHFLLF